MDVCALRLEVRTAPLAAAVHLSPSHGGAWPAQAELSSAANIAVTNHNKTQRTKLLPPHLSCCQQGVNKLLHCSGGRCQLLVTETMYGAYLLPSEHLLH